MKKLAFFLFVAILGLGMAGFASAAPWNKIVVGDTYDDGLAIGPGDKVKIVFKPGTSYDTLITDWGAVAGDVKVKIAGQGVVFVGTPSDESYPIDVINGKVKLKLIGLGGGAIVPSGVGGATLNLAALGNASENPTAAPEPASMLLLGSGLIGLAAVRRRKFFKK